MKIKLTVVLLVLSYITVSAQNRPKFNPKKFETELEQYITTEACLSPQEAAEFFPLYKEMRKKQRSYFLKAGQYRHIDYRDDKLCEKAIRELDDIEIQMKKIQQSYHAKFLKQLPAGKVLKIWRAEEKFHRRAFSRAAGNMRGRNAERHK